MLEKLLNSIKISEKYSVRLIDEVVYRLINEPVMLIEKRKGIPRKRQAVYLGVAGTSIPSWLIFGAEGFKAFQNDQSIPYEILKNKCGYVLLQMFSFSFDLLPLNQEIKAQQRDGTIAENPWDLFIRAIRPYALAGSVAGVAYGLSRDLGIAQYSAVALPWVLSMYVRDENSGGLLEKIGAQLRGMLTFRSPAYQPITVEASQTFSPNNL